MNGARRQLIKDIIFEIVTRGQILNNDFNLI